MNDTISTMEQFIEPSPIRFSPDAPGWYALAAIFLLMLLVVAFFICNNRRKNHYRKVALNWLEQEEKKYLDSHEYNQLIYTANMLAKQISVHQQGNNFSAPLRGTEWLAFLSKTCPSLSFSSTDEHILNSLYEGKENLNEQQAIEFTGKIKQWIKKHHLTS